MAIVGGAREHRVQIADAGVGDPTLRAIDHPVVAVADGSGRHRCHIAAGVGLAEAVAGLAAAVAHPRQHLGLHFIRTEVDHRQHAERRQEHQAGRAQAAPTLDAIACAGGALAAVLLGNCSDVRSAATRALKASSRTQPSRQSRPRGAILSSTGGPLPEPRCSSVRLIRLVLCCPPPARGTAVTCAASSQRGLGTMSANARASS